jgi:D-cysteine desulfhydrase/L-cysteate sulfo-lyase
LSEHLGGPRIIIKRDDCTGLAAGGNKTRKLEFLIADALRQGARKIITTGGLQSNHARQTAAAAARFGLTCDLVLPRVVPRHDAPYESNGNMLLDRLLGATVHIVDRREEADECIRQLHAAATADGLRTYFIPPGGSNALGALGYVDAMLECLTQAEQAGWSPTHHVVATGSGGTHAGLLVGLWCRREHAQRIRGVAVAHAADQHASVVRSLASETAALLGRSVDAWVEQVEVNDRFLGPGYGQPAHSTREAILLTARLEGILLDPVYTGKAMAGLIGMICGGQLSATDQVIFWHTGGATAIHAYPSLWSE